MKASYVTLILNSTGGYEIISSLKLKLIASQKSISKVYFELYEMAEETGFRNLDETIESYIQENEVSILRFMFSLFHTKKRAAVEEIAI